ncbi:MAG: TIGR03435 family protein [Terriglobales bacterium]
MQSLARKAPATAIAILACSIFAQSPPQAGLTFDVASVRMSGPIPPNSPPIPAVGIMSGGPGTSDPQRITYSRVLMRRILINAFGVRPDQIEGPSWVNDNDPATTPAYDIVANVPPGATKEQLNEMMRNLVKERFHLTFHNERKDFDAYTLVVAKGGPKLQESTESKAPPPAPQTEAPAKSEFDQRGFPVIPVGTAAYVTNGLARATFRKVRVSQLLSVLSSQFLGSTHLEDKTGLTGSYDFHLEFSTTGLGGRLAVADTQRKASAGIAADPAPDLFTALEKQLGLKLAKSKVSLDVIVIDHIDKIPTEN